MATKKIRLINFLENIGSYSPMSFSATVLATTPNLRDEDNDDPLNKLTSFYGQSNEESSTEEQEEKVASTLRSLLGSDEEDESRPADIIDRNNNNLAAVQSANTYTHVETPHDRAEEHKQLIAAINDLKQEIHDMRTSKSQPGLPQSEEEEAYEEDESDATKQERARQMFMPLVNQGKSRQDIIDQFMKQIGVTNSTAVSYYQRLAKEAGLTTSGTRDLPGNEPPGLGSASGTEPTALPQGGSEMPTQTSTEEPQSNINGFEVEGDPNRQGLIRTVQGAHLVYKRKEEDGTYDELWVFKTGSDMKDALKVRRAILAGTDIPPKSTKSQDGSQSYTLTSLGNGQLLHIKGLPN